MHEGPGPSNNRSGARSVFLGEVLLNVFQYVGTGFILPVVQQINRKGRRGFRVLVLKISASIIES